MLTILLCLLITIGQLATVIYLPSMPNITHQLSSTPNIIEMTLTLYMLSFGLSQLIYGPLSDQYGRKKIIIIGLCIYIVGSLLSAFAVNANMLLIARLIEGFGAGAITAIARAAVNDNFEGKALTHALTYSTIAASLSSMLAPALGGMIETYFNWRANFIFLTVWTLIILVITLLYFKDKNKPKKDSNAIKATLKKYSELFHCRSFVAYVLLGSISFAGITGYYVASPFLYQHQLLMSPSHYGLLFLITSGGFILGGMVNRICSQVKLRLKIGLLLLLIGALSMLAPAIFHKLSILILLIPATIYMFAVGILYPTAMSCAVAQFKHIAGSASAVMGCSQITAASIATAIVANLSQKTQLPLAIFLCVLLVIVISVFVKLLRPNAQSTT